MKKLVCAMLSFLLFTTCIPSNVLAAETTYPKVSHVYTVEDDYAADDWTTDQKGAYLASGRSSITRTSNNSISISGNTNATQTCDKIRLTLYVERSTSYSTVYGTYKTYAYTADNAYQLTKEISNIPVERGYYYRVVGVHSVTEGNVTETTDSVTNPIDYR